MNTPRSAKALASRTAARKRASSANCNAATLTTYTLDVPGGSSHSTVTPAVMHDSVSGGPMYMVEAAGSGLVGVLTLNKVLIGSPTLAENDVSVAAYSAPPKASQPGGSNLDTIDTRFFNAEWRNNRLVAAHTVSSFSDVVAHARWYEFNTAPAIPTLQQEGTIGTIGSDVYNYGAKSVGSVLIPKMKVAGS